MSALPSIVPQQAAAPGSLNIAGGLPFGGGGGGMFSGDLAGSYAQAYQSSLAMNAQNYANILQGYGQTMNAQQQAQGGIQQGYNQLQGNVLGGIQDITASQRQAIQDVYAQQSGAATQSLISRGLGNTTVQDATQRGLRLDEQKAQVALANQQAQLTAGYQSQLGQAGLNYANQANMQNTALASQQLGFMNSVQAQYPSAQAYTNLLQQQGALKAQQQNADLYGNILRGRYGAGAAPQAGGVIVGRTRQPGMLGSQSNMFGPGQAGTPYTSAPGASMLSQGSLNYRAGQPQTMNLYGSDNTTAGLNWPQYGITGQGQAQAQGAGVDLYGGGIDQYGNPQQPGAEWVYSGEGGAGGDF